MRIIIFLILTICLEQSFAINEFYNDSDRGWYWHEDPPLEPEEPEPTPLAIPTPAESAETNEVAKELPPPVGSVAWVRAQLPKLRDAAIDNPTAGNVRKYLYINRMMMDKAQQFSDVADYVATLDPYLMNRDKGPQSDGGKMLKKKITRENTDDVLRNISEQAGLLFFYSSTCPYCHKMIGIINFLKNKYDFKIKMISMDGNPMPGWSGEWQNDSGLSIQLNVQSTPATYLIKPSGKGQQPEILEIGQGFLSLSEFTKIAILQAKEYGWISEDRYNSTTGHTPVIVNAPAESSVPVDPIDMDEKEFVDMVKRQLNLL